MRCCSTEPVGERWQHGGVERQARRNTREVEPRDSTVVAPHTRRPKTPGTSARAGEPRACGGRRRPGSTPRDSPEIARRVSLSCASALMRTRATSSSERMTCSAQRSPSASSRSFPGVRMTIESGFPSSESWSGSSAATWSRSSRQSPARHRATWTGGAADEAPLDARRSLASALS